MTKLPVLRPLEVLKKLEKAGFVVTRQTGSHARLIHSDGRATTVALHSRDLPKGTLRAILRQCEMTTEEFQKI
jgi:predicted RNA binding protein YcfA (HicA-like mRNA interferase family)